MSLLGQPKQPVCAMAINDQEDWSSDQREAWTSRIQRAFSKLAQRSADAMGSATAFVLATAICIVWALSGPLFGYSDSWQLVINTATTVLTFLAVFLIQHTQNKEGRALQLKLDELIRSTDAARKRLIDLENCTDDELRQLQQEFAKRRLEPDRTTKKDGLKAAS
jgi:low affinity Fe/Cu permease